LNTGRSSLKRRLLPALCVCLGILIFSTLLYTGTIWPNALFAANYHVLGIDVSSYQKNVDWKSVAHTGEYTFAFIKATEGTTYQDAYFQENWRETRENGLLRSAYHFYITSVTGAEQADNYISLVPREVGMLPPVLDLEVTGPDHTAMLREIRVFLERLEHYYGLKPIIYVDHDRYAEYIKGNFDNYAIWIRDIILPPQWTETQNWTFWQYNSRGHVPGIAGYVDLNAFYGEKEQISRLLKQ
jgi:lysozyme